MSLAGYFQSTFAEGPGKLVLGNASYDFNWTGKELGFEGF